MEVVGNMRGVNVEIAGRVLDLPAKKPIVQKMMNVRTVHEHHAVNVETWSIRRVIDQ